MNSPWLIPIALTALSFGVISNAHSAEPAMSPKLLARIDHLVYAVPDLNLGIGAVEKLLGIKATPGGQHLGRGTRNALIALGPALYLEIIGPDPQQPNPDGGRWFGIDGLAAPRLATWAANGTQLRKLVRQARDQGIELGEVLSRSRTRPDGIVLSWEVTDPRKVLADGLVPFFIDWGKTTHPALGAAQGALLLDLRAEHPDADRAQKLLNDLDLELRVETGMAPALIATIASPRDIVELR